MNSMNSVIAFDFDGTLADSFELFVEAFRKVAPVKKPSSIDIEKLRGMSVKEVIKELGVKKWQIPRLVVDGRKEMAKGVNALQLFPGIKESLEELKKEGNKLIVLSSNSPENIRKCLENNSVSEYFDDIIGDIGLTSKPKVIKKLASKANETIIYVGDEVRDVEASHKAGVRCVAVTWGFNTEEALVKSSPDWVVNSPSELSKLLLAREDDA